MCKTNFKQNENTKPVRNSERKGKGILKGVLDIILSYKNKKKSRQLAVNR